MKTKMKTNHRYVTTIFKKQRVVVVITSYDYTERILRNIARKAVQEAHKGEDGWAVRHGLTITADGSKEPATVHLYSYQNAKTTCERLIEDEAETISQLVDMLHAKKLSERMIK